MSAAVLLALASPETSGIAPEVSRGFVILVSPPGDETTDEVVFRSAAELTAAGYTARISPCAPRLQPDCASPPGADAVSLLAVVRFERFGAGQVTDLQILDGHGVRLRRRVGADQRDDSAAVAVQLVELVRASLLRAAAGELGPAGEPTPGMPVEIEGPPPPPVPPRPRLVMETPAPPPTTVARERGERPGPARPIRVGLGGAIWQSTGGVGPALGPMLDVHVGATGSPWMMGFELHVLPSAPPIETSYFSATMQQEVGALQIGRRFRSGQRLQLDATVGAGVYHASVDGAPMGLGTFTIKPAARSMWSAAFTVGGDASYTVGGALALFAGARLMLAQPYASVAILGREQATAGHPSLGLLAGARLEL